MNQQYRLKITISKSKYIISPEGAGIDCHRIYEAIYFDCVPILQTSLLDNFYMNLPLLIVKHWSDINETYLNNNYDMFYRQLVDWKGRNPNWMSPSFWLQQFQDSNLSDHFDVRLSAKPRIESVH